MKARFLLAALAGFAVAAPALWAASKSVSDLDPLPKRQQTIETAERLTRPFTPVVLPPNLVSLFNPPNFDVPDVDSSVAAGAPRGPAAPPTPRELLELIAARIPPTGTMSNLSGETLLTFGTKRVRRGDIIGVEYNGQTHDLELVAIDRTTFTLRYRGEEITRPIKPTK